MLRAYAIHPSRRKVAIEGGPAIYRIQATVSRRPPVAVARETYMCPTAPNLGSLLHKQATYMLRDNRALIGELTVHGLVNRFEKKVTHDTSGGNKNEKRAVIVSKICNFNQKAISVLTLIFWNNNKPSIIFFILNRSI